MSVRKQGAPKYYRLCYDGLSDEAERNMNEVVLSVSGVMVKSDFVKGLKDEP